MQTTVEAVYEDGEVPSKAIKNTPAEILAEIAALTVDNGLPETESIDHDKILYRTNDED